MPYSISVTFGESDTMRCGKSAAPAITADNNATSNARFISKLPLRTGRDANAWRAIPVFEIRLIEEIVGFEVEAHGGKFAHRTSIADGSLSAPGPGESKCVAGDRIKIAAGTGEAEISHQSGCEPLRRKYRVLVARNLVGLPDTRNQRCSLPPIRVCISPGQLQRAGDGNVRTELDAARQPAAGIAIAAVAPKRIGELVDDS